MAEAGILLPPNPRVNFMLAHGAAMDRWKVIPFYLGFVTAPLWDHRSRTQQTIIILGFVAASFLWSHLLQPWVDGRIGVFRPRVDIFRKRSSGSGLSKEVVWRQRRRKAIVYTMAMGAFFAVSLGVAYLFHFHDYRENGWLEHGSYIWIFGAAKDCVDRAADTTDLRARRMWNIGAAIFLAAVFGFSGATPNSYAIVLVLIGVVNIALALLDLGLLLHFAATPISLREREAYE